MRINHPILLISKLKGFFDQSLVEARPAYTVGRNWMLKSRPYFPSSHISHA